jgi:caspase domain-containing protein
MRTSTCVIAIIVMCLAISARAQTQQPDGGFYPGTGEYQLARRLALVIGVTKLSDNAGFIGLTNPGRDAAKVESALEKAGFDVTNLSEVYAPEQLTRQNIKKGLYDFARKLNAGGVGLIYFSGHGIERQGQTYLVPHDAYVRYERDLNEELISLSLLYETFAHANNPINIIVLDACRDNPWAQPLQQFGSPTVPGPTPASPNVILATSAISGGKALDGGGEGGPFANAFVAAMQQPDAGISEFFGAIGISMLQLRERFPTVNIPSLTVPPGRDFIFVPTLASFNRERVIFEAAQKSRQALKNLVWKFSGGYFYKVAKNRLDNPPDSILMAALPLRLAALRNESNVRVNPSLSGRVLNTQPAGTTFELMGEVVGRGSDTWAPVNYEGRDAPAYVKADRLELLPQKLTPQIVKLGFVKTSQPGIESLSDESKRNVQLALRPDKKDLVTGISLVGYNPPGGGTENPHNLQLLARQAVALLALSDAGYDASKVPLSFREATLGEQIGSVELSISEAVSPR